MKGNRNVRNRIEIYTKDWCGFSARAKALLDAKGLDYHEIDVTEDTVREREMIARSGRRTVPQVFIDGEPVGGSDNLARLEATGALDRILGIGAAPGPARNDNTALADAGLARRAGTMAA